MVIPCPSSGYQRAKRPTLQILNRVVPFHAANVSQALAARYAKTLSIASASWVASRKETNQ